ncbi:hypothetical protein Tco_1000482 [Tanacetum coccineum]
MAQLPLKSEEELCPTKVSFPPNKRNVRIDPEETQDEPIFELCLEILKNNIVYTALTASSKVPLIYIYLLGQHWTLYKRLDSTTTLVSDDTMLENMKYVAKGERKLTFGMPIPEALLSRFMKMGDVPKPKKKKDVAPTKSKTPTTKENMLSDSNDVVEYAKQVSAALESPNHSNSSNDSSESVDDDKTESEHDLEHNDTDDDSEQGDAMYTEAITIMTVALVLNIIHEEEQVTSNPPATPPIKSNTKRTRVLLKKAINKKNDWKKAVMQRLTNLEQKNYDDIIKESVQENVLNALKNQLPKLLPNFYEKMFLTAAYLTHPKHHALYDALAESMQIDELDARFGSTNSSHGNRTYDDQDDPHNREGDKKSQKRQEDEPRHDNEQKSAKELPIQSWFNELVDAEEEPEEYEYRDVLVTQFGKLVKKMFKKDVITKADVDGLSFELLKGTCKNSIEMEHNMNQVSLALTDKIDWVNPESGDRFQKDLSKPLPLTGPPSKKRIPVKYFFNHDLEYLMNGTKKTPRVFKSTTEMLNWEFLTGTLDVSGSTKATLDLSPVMKFTPRSTSEAFNVSKFSRNLSVVYEGVDNRKRLMRSDKLHKFSDGTLNKVLSKLEIIMRNNKLGYDNEGMKKYYWTKDDDKKTKKFVENIKKALKERRRFRRLELFVGGRHDKTDYRL